MLYRDDILRLSLPVSHKVQVTCDPSLGALPRSNILPNKKQTSINPKSHLTGLVFNPVVDLNQQNPEQYI